MFKKFHFKIGRKAVYLREISVGEYWTMITDIEQFFLEYFSEFGVDYKKLPTEQIEIILSKIFQISEKNKNPFENKKEVKSIDDFHITIGRFMFVMHLSYQQVCEMPLSVFEKMLEDFEYIAGEKEKKQGNSFLSEKEKLKQLFS